MNDSRRVAKRSVTWSAPWRVLLALLALAAASWGCSGPDTPSKSAYPIAIQYQAPAAGTLPPPTIDDAMCFHHNAPLNLALSTNWGAEGRLNATGTDLYGLTLADVPVNRDLWVSFLDINLCPTGQVYVTRGVSVNGTVLTRVTTDGAGRPALAFRLDAHGVVVP
jgi:hypothetical protein